MNKMLSLSFVSGAEPTKWFQRYASFTANPPLQTSTSDDPLAELLAGNVTMALVRLPDARLDAVADAYHKVELYEEDRGVAVPADSIYAQLGERAVSLPELDEEIVNYRIPPSGEVVVAEVRAALQVVAANVGIAIAPRPLLRVLSGNQVVPLSLAEAADTVPATRIALVWRKADDSEAIQDFVGITKGRRAGSARHQNAADAMPAGRSGGRARAGRAGSARGGSVHAGKATRKGGQDSGASRRSDRSRRRKKRR